MLVLVALLDGHGIPGALFSTPAVAGYLGGAVTPFSAEVDPKSAWDALLAIERAGLITVNRAVSPPTIGIELGPAGGSQAGGACRSIQEHRSAPRPPSRCGELAGR